MEAARAHYHQEPEPVYEAAQHAPAYVAPPAPESAPAPELHPEPQPAPPPRPRRRFNLKQALRAIFTTHLSKSRFRILLTAVAFAALFLLFIGRLAYFGAKPDPHSIRREASEAISAARPELVDRNGELLAMDVKVMSVFAEPRRIIDKDEATELITAVLPDVNARELREKLGSHKGFVWIKRGVTPSQQQQIFRLGLPGVGFLPENKRIYPNGPLGAHVLGFTNSDNNGIAGIEKYIDSQGLSDLHDAGFNLAPENLKPIALSLDMRATHALRDELVHGVERFQAKAAAAAILDVNTGEVIAEASLPDYDPNNPVDALKSNNINRLTVGVYEMGSTFKALTTAMALDSGKVNLNSHIDARTELRWGRGVIHDYHATHRVLTVPEVFVHSSNIGSARMALMVGVEGHKAFLRKMGQMDRMRTELPENAEPIVPRHWSEVSTMTIAFGHGLAVAPLQAMMAVGALTNGGYMITPTFLKRPPDFRKENMPRVIKPETSEALRYIMRLNAEIGSARKANIPGYFVGGKTGTAEKVIGGRYAHNRLFTTFMALVPADKPRYLFMTVMDEPQGLPEDGHYATAAYNSGYVTGKLIERVSPLLGLEPRLELPKEPFPLLAKLGYGFANSPAKPGGGEH
ncbi:MAG TPA: penicillin-binding protein 2 [Rhodoblastus sp.]|nr:penicillin-binding protein 2 [Rhodoblastus sp.]